jgi:DNA-binding transcriptional ArsR family regulator
MVEQAEPLDLVYRALADPTRRGLLTTLRSGEARIKDLAAPLPMSFAGVARHVAILEKAQLISRDVRGREHWISIRPRGLNGAEAWIAEQTAAWSARADALVEYLEQEEG